MNENRVKYYENLITKTLNRSSILGDKDEGGGGGGGENFEPKKKRQKKNQNQKRDLNKGNNPPSLTNIELVVGIYHFLVFNPRKYASKWNYSGLISILEVDTAESDSDGQLVKWFIVKICSLLLNFTPVQETELFAAYFKSSSVLEQCYLRAHEILLDDASKQDSLAMNREKSKIVTNFTKIELDEFRNEEEDDNDNEEEETDKLPSTYLSFDNGLKLRVKTSNVVENNEDPANELVMIETAVRNMNKLVMSIVTDCCIMVEGELSTGKTTLIESLAHKTNNTLIKYQMDEYMDSKSLVGNYICSEIPGEFVWKPGPLYQAVSNGNWILLEDVDHSPVDSLSLLIDLLETKSIKTSDSVIYIRPNFRLFLTLRPSHGKRANSSFIDTIQKLSRHVLLDSYQDTEIIEIICEKYPNFGKSTTKIADKLLEVYKSLKYSEESGSVSKSASQTDLAKEDVVSGISFATYRASFAKEGRFLSLRDLLKLCNRLIYTRLGGDINHNQRKFILTLLNDLYECFLCFISNVQVREELALSIGYKLNINKEEVKSLLINNKPGFEKTEHEIKCGRVTLRLNQTDILDQSLINSLTSKFVYTKASLRLLEKIARCIECNEPVLLCGETGVGKTTALQHLARLMGKSISVINLNHQTETSDLLGSFKPVDIKSQMKLVKERFLSLFCRCFDLQENKKFLEHVNSCFSSSNWQFFIRLTLHATDSACSKFKQDKKNPHLIKEWRDLKATIAKLNDNLESLIDKFSFKFFEAIVNGEWIILDEINLASSETLQFLGTLLEDTSSKSSSIILYEKGDSEPLLRHRDFRLFGAMNPASDVGKRNLPSNIRSRFTEIFVDELSDVQDLTLMCKSYLSGLTDVTPALVKSIVDFYTTIRNKESDLAKKLSNGTGMPPTYSLRTLCRALAYAAKNYCSNTRVSVYDGLCLSFSTDLNRESAARVEEFIRDSILGPSNKSAVRIQRSRPAVEVFSGGPSRKAQSLGHVMVEDYWIMRGPNEPAEDKSFVFTKSVRENLKRLARVSSARLPCLIQGDTSIGKTSLIKWLAKATGNELVRINNHDHTDLSEYIGTYSLDPVTSRLRFQEGHLVQAMRQGHWILLDELNLASSEVLEALNRVLDDNRELYIAETQELVRAHPRFLLFATQNPAGKYAGRKQLSRAFRNRFIELHFEDLPELELLDIVETRCQLPRSYAQLLVKTVSELKTKRSQTSGLFLGKNSLITLRDLFRWAKRFANADQDEKECDWKQYLAEQGLLLLGSRCRCEQDVITIHGCIERVFKKKIDLDNLKDPKTLTKPIMKILNQVIEHSKQKPELSSFVWTPSARRLGLLTSLAYKFNEPFLLVGDTGVGKTTICQLLASLNQKPLHIVNCHMHSEAADFLGSMRPVRQDSSSSSSTERLFEWCDGPLVIACRGGDDFLIDEISLADDSVLERLNSLLEDERTLLIAETGIQLQQGSEILVNGRFRICATMNPAGDFGKKELSAALRNRFNEIWCPAPKIDSGEFRLIAEHGLVCKDTHIKSISIDVVCEFLTWLSQQTFFRHSSSSNSVFSIRDLTTWIKFINKSTSLDNTHSSITRMESFNRDLDPLIALIHGANLVFIDSLSFSSSDSAERSPRDHCLDFLLHSIKSKLPSNQADLIAHLFDSSLERTVENHADYFKCGAFSIKKGESRTGENHEEVYCLDAQTTASKNLLRIMRCLMMDMPIMLEGSPGVGKTSMVEALGRLTRNRVIRINLSEQTDLNELFGADLPCVSDQQTTQQSQQQQKQQQRFQWHDGPFLMALKKGYWIILDEINLASQSVLEGLNACFDHRSEVFIAELGRTFQVRKSHTKIFACQNPFSQGGGRKGLPRSFLNRFAKVYMDALTHDDLLHVATRLYPRLVAHLPQMIAFNERIARETGVERKWASLGAPWEFNLRDVFRWCDLVERSHESAPHPRDFVYLIYSVRFRSPNDRKRVREIFEEVFECQPYWQESVSRAVRFTRSHLQIGQCFLPYSAQFKNRLGIKPNRYYFTDSNLKHLEAIAKCIEMNWMCILVGKSCTGKTTLVRMLANLLGVNLVEFSVNNSTDTSDLLGGFEKVKHQKSLIMNTYDHLRSIYMQAVVSKSQSQSQSPSRLALVRSFFLFMFEARNLMRSAASELDDNVEVSEAALKLFRRNLDVLKSFKLDESNEFASAVEELSQSISNSGSRGRKMKFEWLDSALVKAITNGDWVLIDNANFCAPSVLDRLNPLLERNGRLQINEKGIQPDENDSEGGKLIEIAPHSNFRLILSLNETFGELSRPMRNRGIEIYIPELDLQSDIEDVLIVLADLFPFSPNLSDYSNLVSSFDKITYPELFRLSKLTYDYWIVSNRSDSISQALGRALVDSKRNLSLLKDVDSIKTDFEQRSFFSDVFKLREFPIYRFLFDFPLFPRFIADTEKILGRVELDLNSFASRFVVITKWCNLLAEWMRSIPFDDYSLVATFTRDIVVSRIGRKAFNQSVESLFAFLNDITQSALFVNFRTSLRQIGEHLGLDLATESIDIKSNTYLCRRLSEHFDFDGLNRLSQALDLALKLFMSKYRVECSYHEHNESLTRMIAKDKSSDDGSNFKFAHVVKEFARRLCTDLVDYLTRSLDLELDMPHIEALVMPVVYLIEKFYLICASCPFDSFLTLAYAKYYWNFIYSGLETISHSLNNCFSPEFDALKSLVALNLSYDDSLYKIYYTLWHGLKKPNLELHNANAINLSQANDLNQHLITHSIFNHLNKSLKLAEFLPLLTNIERISLDLKEDDLTIASEKPIIQAIEIEDDDDYTLKSILIKSQLIPVREYLRVSEQLLTGDKSQPKLTHINNLIELITNRLDFGQGYSLFARTSLESFKFIQILTDLIRIEPSESIRSKLSQTYRSWQDLTRAGQNFLNQNWIDVYSMRLYSLDLSTLRISYVRPIELVLSFHDERVAQIDRLGDLMWANYDKMSPQTSQIETRIVEDIRSCLNRIRTEYFNDNDELIEEYLVRKGASRDFIRNVNNNVLKYGYIIAYLFAPIDPMDPLENDNLIKENQLDLDDIVDDEKRIKYNNSLKLKYHDISEMLGIEKHRNLPQRASKSDYFGIKNEVENAMRQFLNVEQLNKLASGSSRPEEYRTWLISLQNFIDKLMSEYYSHADVLYAPINGLSLVGYSVSSVYTRSLINPTSNDLVELLMKFPYDLGEYYSMANRLGEFAKSSNLPPKLADEINVLVLLHLVNAVRSETESYERVSEVFWRVCWHFCERYKAYKQAKDELDKVETYKYKEYGQKETQDELDAIEYDQHFPNYEANFEEFITRDVLKDQPQRNNATDKNNNSTNEIHLDVDLYNQVFDLIDLVINTSDKTDSNRLKMHTFLRSYSIATSLATSTLHSPKNFTLSHILFGSTVHSTCDPFKPRVSTIYDIYRDSNRSQVLALHNELALLRKRIDMCLADWPKDPVLMELVKLIGRLESFDLSEPLMKYLTGVELLLERSQNWQQVSSKQYSLDEELKRLNAIVVEWRKLELKHWVTSIDIELDKAKRNSCYVWFFNLLALCVEFLTADSDETYSGEDVLKTLNQFILSSTVGDYHIRIKNFSMCLQILLLFPIQPSPASSRLKYLTRTLSSLLNYYESLFTKALETDMQSNKKEIEKELRDFVGIYKWQDANYWSLKQSIQKSNRVLLRTIRKFKSYLKTPVEFDRLIKLSPPLCPSNHKLLVEYFKLNDITSEESYLKKMFKFSRRLLTAKFAKNRLNRSIESLTSRIQERYSSLDKETKALNVRFASATKDKEATAKLKKEFKYLNQEKLKFISDLIKELAAIGLSYRRGNIYQQESKATLETSILKSLPPSEDDLESLGNDASTTRSLISQLSRTFDLCTNRYFAFTNIYPSGQASAVLPCEKLNGLVAHLFDMLTRQANALYSLSSHLCTMRTNNRRFFARLASSNRFEPDFGSRLNDYEEFLRLARRARNLVGQTDRFFSDAASSIPTVGRSFQDTRERFEALRKLIRDRYDDLNELEFAFVNDENKDLKNPNNRSELLSELKELCDSLSEKCAPFYPFYQELLQTADNDSSKTTEMSESELNREAEEAKTMKKLKKLNAHMLKPIETLYKKYLNSENESKVIKKISVDRNGCFTEECVLNLTQDAASFDLTTINKTCAKLTKQIGELIHQKNGQFMSEIINEVKNLKPYLDLFEEFSTKWCAYLIEVNLNSSKLFLALAEMFTELKKNGLSQPPEFDENEEDGDGGGRSDKFETSDVAGLGEGEGAKDVSDQIENEDQLDDAKTKEEREKEKNEEKDDEEKTKEEENGIEMSDDFDAKMEDVEREEKDENNEEEDDEDEDEVDDQKGSVEDPMDALDKNLWNEDDKNDEEEDEMDENGDGEDEDNNLGDGEKIRDEKSELTAKQEELPMIDHEEGEGDDEKQGEEEDEEEYEMRLGEDEEEEKEDEKNESGKEKDKEKGSEEQEEGQNNNEETENTEEAKEDEDEKGEVNPDELAEKLEDEEEENEEEREDKEEQHPDVNVENKKNYESKQSEYSAEKDIENKSKSEALEVAEAEDEDENDEEKDQSNPNEDESAKNEMKTGKSDNKPSSNDYTQEASSAKRKSNETNEKKRKLGKKNENRILEKDDVQKDKLDDRNAIDIDEDEDEAKKEDAEKISEAADEELRHLKDDKEKSDKQVYDAATDKQKERAKKETESEENQKEEKDEKMDEEPDDSEENPKNKDDEKKNKLHNQAMNQQDDDDENIKKGSKKESKESQPEDRRENSADDYVATMGASNNESFFASNLDEFKREPLTTTTRDEVEKDLAKFKEICLNEQPGLIESECLKLWLEYESITSQLSKELCEQLRLILEPTVCSKLKGDYKTGKRLNMKRMVEYIATEYRKDKIWLRRTKPHKRDYQVMLAVDNSSSMSDNHCMQLAYETIATLSNAFNFLEVGELGLVSFGEKCDVLHNFYEPFNSDAGAKILGRVNFKDERTKIAEMLNVAVDLFNSNQSSSSKPSSSNVAISKLLIILSDGRGVFYEGVDRVKSAVQNALSQGIFIIFVILDITDKNWSIFDIKMQVNAPGNPVPMIKSYMENFPFPFYVVLREINSLPLIMIEALKQWFEMVTKLDS